MEKVIAKVETITPEIAREYLKANVVNRPLNQRTVKYYAEQMKNGQWKMNGEPICFSRSGAMGNGQHRLNAVIEYGGPIDMLVVRGCEDGSFVTYDSGRNRTLSDVFSLDGIPNSSTVAGIVNKYIAITKTGKGDMKNFAGMMYRKISKQDALDEYNKSPAFYQDVCQFARSCSYKMNVLSPSEIGAIITYLHKDKKHDIEYIKDFFNKIYIPETNSLKVISIFREKLLKSKLSNIKMSAKLRDALFKKVWNYYVLGKDVGTLRYNEEAEGEIEFL